MNYTISKNEHFNSFEIFFDEIPEKATRDNLKALGFRWHAVKKCWYGYKDEETIKAAIDRNEIKKTAPQKKTEVVNEFGVKVGDVFMMSWGYEQTNNDFFQVVAVTAKKARIVEVIPPHETEWTAYLASDNRLTFKEGEMLPKAERSIWIKDNENGDLKSIRDYSKDKSNPWIIIDSRSYSFTASRCHSGETYYESHYA